MKQLKVALATFALLFGLSGAAMAQFDEPTNRSGSPSSTMEVETNTTIDTSNTTTTTTVTTVDNSASIAAQVEALRAQELAELNPHFHLMLNQIADQLDPDQASTLQGWAVTMNPVDLALLDEDEQVSFLAEMTQRLNLRGSQVEEIRPILAEHLGQMHAIHLTYLSREQAILATRIERTTTISAPAETNINTTTIERTETTTTEVVPAPAPEPAPSVKVKGTQTEQRTFIRNTDLK